jgi:RNase H-fold protein (predicted Holliday junction resolvase)
MEKREFIRRRRKKEENGKNLKLIYKFNHLISKFRAQNIKTQDERESASLAKQLKSA